MANDSSFTSSFGRNISWALGHSRIYVTTFILLVGEAPAKTHIRYLLRRPEGRALGEDGKRGNKEKQRKQKEDELRQAGRQE